MKFFFMKYERYSRVRVFVLFTLGLSVTGGLGIGGLGGRGVCVVGVGGTGVGGTCQTDKDKIIQRYSASEIKEHTQIHTG